MIFSILRSLRYFALLASNTSLLTLHPYIDVAFAAPTLETRSVGPWSGKGNLVVHQGATTIGCITANGEWTVGGQCGVFSAAPQGSSATQLTTSAGQCGFDSTWKFICEVGNPNGPENWHNRGYLLLFGHIYNGYLWTPSAPTGTGSVVINLSPAAEQVQLYWQQL